MFAGTGSPFGDEEGVGNSLRIKAISGSPLIEPLIKFIGKKYGADLSAIITTGAFSYPHNADVSRTLYLEMSSSPIKETISASVRI